MATVCELPIAAAAAVGLSGALAGLAHLAATPRLLPRSQPPCPVVPALPQKAKAALSEAKPASPCAPEFRSKPK